MSLAHMMRYYILYLLPESGDLKTVVIEFVKFIYNRFLMRICASSDIFQAKAYEILSDIEGFKI